MPGRRCVVQDCGNIKNDELGISIHNSPASGSVMLKWKSFVSMHRKNFNPVGQFAVSLNSAILDCARTILFCLDMTCRLKPFVCNNNIAYKLSV